MGTIAVTGVNGYIGSCVAKRLLDNGFNVIGLSIEEKSIIEHPSFVYMQVDLTNWVNVQSIIKENNIDVLLHFAGIAHVIKGQKTPDEIYKRINYLAAKNLFNCTYSKDIKVFFASSVDVYGACKERLWNEDVIPRPVSMYGKTKYMAECSLNELYKGKKDKYLIGRFAPVYSEDHLNDAYKRIYIKYPKLAITLDNKPAYSLLALNNLVNFIVWWVQGGIPKKNIINVCDASEIIADDFIALEKRTGRAKNVIHIPRTLARVFAWIANKLLYSDTKAELGFTLIKFFDPRAIDKLQIINTRCCCDSINKIIK